MAEDGSDRSERPTIRPRFDPGEYARHSEKLLAVAPAEAAVQPPPPDQRAAPVSSADDLAATLPLRPSVPARRRQTRMVAVAVAAFIGAVSLVAHRAGSSSAVPSPAAEAPSATLVAPEPRGTEIAPAPEVEDRSPARPPPRAEPAHSPSAVAPRAPPSKTSAPAAQATRRRDPALDRDAVLNPFE